MLLRDWYAMRTLLLRRYLLLLHLGVLHESLISRVWIVVVDSSVGSVLSYPAQIGWQWVLLECNIILLKEAVHPYTWVIVLSIDSCFSRNLLIQCLRNLLSEISYGWILISWIIHSRLRGLFLRVIGLGPTSEMALTLGLLYPQVFWRALIRIIQRAALRGDGRVLVREIVIPSEVSLTCHWLLMV